MKYNSITPNENGGYKINDHQYFIFDKEKAKEIMNNVKFPAIVLDTEFFNVSHYKEQTKRKLYEEIGEDIVFLIQYSFASNFKEIANRENRKAIKSLSIKRLYNDETYNFEEQYNRMIISFLNMCVNKNIKTIVCAGSFNDIRIINKWIKDRKSLFVRKNIDLLVVNKNEEEGHVNSFDVYSILENAIKFSNKTASGEEFLDVKNVQIDKENELATLPSSKKLFNWFDKASRIQFKEEKDTIYHMACKCLTFYSYVDKEVDFNKHMSLNKVIKDVSSHCFDDVLRMLEFLAFSYCFAYLEDDKNPYIKKQ